MPSPRASTAWSTEEDDLLKSNRAKNLGWKVIAEHFDGKTANACRKRHERLMEKKKLDDWNPRKTEDLARGYLELRQTMWSMLAERVNEDWKTVEQKCFEEGVKNMQATVRKSSRQQNRHSPTRSSRTQQLGHQPLSVIPQSHTIPSQSTHAMSNAHMFDSGLEMSGMSTYPLYSDGSFSTDQTMSGGHRR
ncbi:MAG: hypothetical protein M1815_002074 [Lichina confinis]|nr:MAG: hypothetical protein M1815_002074 [Lichina confinis]